MGKTIARTNTKVELFERDFLVSVSANAESQILMPPEIDFNRTYC